MKESTRFTICWFLASILVMFDIFWFSSQNADISSQQSGWVLETFFFWLDSENAVWLIRKSAHFAIYLILGFCLGMGFYYPCHARAGMICTGALAVAASYAATDEFHQLFISGRSGQLSDVMLDSAGALCGIACMLVWMFCLHSNR